MSNNHTGSTRSHLQSLPVSHLRRYGAMPFLSLDTKSCDNVGAATKHYVDTSSVVVEPKCTQTHSKKSVSPYFTSPVSQEEGSTSKRPLRGTVSCLPFPPLTSLSFGLVQEKEAHDPFWLLIAITFLIRTTGKAAIPVFYAVKKRFPTPADVADPLNAKTILAMILHLGLSITRLRHLQRYAVIFMDDPPQDGKTYRVRNYDRRDTGPSPTESSLNGFPNSQSGILTPREDEEDTEAWEIGHMTQGKYAIDSWRIFCRDKLLNRAENWNGKGREPEVQPEWMRVMPDDKELRAYLRWMWMREGWEWDPLTGERIVLRVEMQKAVNEGRVEWDGTGNLRLMDEPQPVYV